MHQILNLQFYNLAIIFLRIGSAIMFMPGFMTSYVNMKLRLSIALAITLIIMPALADTIPFPNSNFAENLRICIIEITYGIFLGLCMQMLFMALSLAGNTAGQAIGFSNAQMFDPAFQTQSIPI